MKIPFINQTKRGKIRCWDYPVKSILFKSHIFSDSNANTKNNKEQCIILPNKKIKSLIISQLQRDHSTNINYFIFTIDELLEKITNLKLAQDIDSIQLLYKISNKVLDKEEAFEGFYPWGKALLNDFNNIDSNLADASKVFRTLKNQKEIDTNTEFLSEAQKRIISQFWNTFSFKSKKHHIENTFLKTWNLIYEIYKIFSSEVSKTKCLHKGGLYKKAAEMIDNHQIEFRYRKSYIIGFSTLNKCEIKLFQYLTKMHSSEIIFDIDRYYIEKKEIPLSKLFKDSTRHFSIKFDNIPSIIETKNINITKYNSIYDEIRNTIKEINRHGNFSKTAIVLVNESMIKIVIDELKKYNISYTTQIDGEIKYSKSYILISNVIDYFTLKFKNRITNLGEETNIIDNICHHKYFRQYFKAININIYQSFENNKNFENFVSLFTTQEINLQFEQNIDHLHSFFINLCYSFIKYVTFENNFEKNVINTIKDHINKLNFNSILKKNNEISTLNYLFNLKIQLSNINIKDVELEDTNSVSILSIVGSKCSYFDNVYILSLNEGYFPPTQEYISNIPENIKIGYDLERYKTTKYLEYIHCFFLLIQNSSRIYLSYISKSTTQVLEPSRLILALQYEENLKINYSEVNDSMTEILDHSGLTSIVISKNKLPDIKKNNIFKKGLSVTAINTYVDCELKFFFKYLINLKVETKINDHLFLGQVLHSSLEKLYDNKNIINKKFNYSVEEIKDTIYKSINEIYNLDIKPHITDSDSNVNINDHFSTSDIEVGKIRLIINLIINIIAKILDIDKKKLPFKVKGVEVGKKGELDTSICLKDDIEVKIRGLIDRIDLKDNLIKIIDYKTGNYNLDIRSIESLFEKDNQYRNVVALQLIFYSYLYYKKSPQNSITPLIYGIKNLFKDRENQKLRIKNEKNYEIIEDIIPFLPTFEKYLMVLVEEILFTKESFCQTDNIKICKSCDFNDFCQKV